MRMVWGVLILGGTEPQDAKVPIWMKNVVRLTGPHHACCFETLREKLKSK